MPVSYDFTTGGQYPTPATPISLGAGIPGGTTQLVLQPLIQIKVLFPDSYGNAGAGVLTIAGKVASVNTTTNTLNTAVTMTPTTIAFSTFLTVSATGSYPVSTTTYWILQVCTNATYGTVGTVSVLTSTVATPTAATGNTLIFSHKATANDVIPWSAGAGSACTTLGTAPVFNDLN